MLATARAVLQQQTERGPMAGSAGWPWSVRLPGIAEHDLVPGRDRRAPGPAADRLTHRALANRARRGLQIIGVGTGSIAAGGRRR